MQQIESKKPQVIVSNSIKKPNFYFSQLSQYAEVRGKYARPAVNVTFKSTEQQSKSMTNTRPKTSEGRMRQSNLIHEFDPFISYLEKSSKIGLSSLNDKKIFNQSQITEKNSSTELNKVKIEGSKHKAEISASIKKQKQTCESKVITEMLPKVEKSFSKSVDGRRTSKSFNAAKAKYIKELEDSINQEKFHTRKLQQKISSLV